MHNLKFSLFTLCLCLFMVNSKETEQLLKISVPVTEVEHSDQYLCHAFRLDEVKEAFIRRVYVDVKSEMVHHVTLSICESPITNNSLWTCARDQGKTCTGNAVNINGYDSKTKNVGRYEFPKEITAPIVNVTIYYTEGVAKGLQFQTYSHISEGYIPAKSIDGFFAEVACPWQKPTVIAYRYTTHTHDYEPLSELLKAVMAEGYLIRNGTWRLLGSELTKHRLQDWTEIPGGPVRIEPGDVIASRCLYINENDTPVKFGLTHKEEMCVFEIDFGFEDQYQDEFKRPLGCIETSPTFSFCKVKPLESVCNNYKL